MGIAAPGVWGMLRGGMAAAPSVEVGAPLGEKRIAAPGTAPRVASEHVSVRRVWTIPTLVRRCGIVSVTLHVSGSVC